MNFMLIKLQNGDDDYPNPVELPIQKPQEIPEAPGTEQSPAQEPPLELPDIQDPIPHPPAKSNYFD